MQFFICAISDQFFPLIMINVKRQINVTKLESRPLPDREFEFLFYFDLETSIYSQEYVQLMCQLSELCQEFQYLGSYSEVV